MSGKWEHGAWRAWPCVGLMACVGCYGGLGASDSGEASASAGETDGADDGGDAQDGGETGDDGADGSDDDGAAVDCANVGAGLAPMRRLTKAQYDNTIRDLFDGAVEAGDTFPASIIHEAYSNNPAANIVSLAGAEDIMLAAEGAGEQVIDQVDTVVPCAPSAQCAYDFIDDFGRRAFRRPLTTTERDALRAAFDAVDSEEGFADGIGTLVTIVLQSPQFLYLLEAGVAVEEAGVVELTDYELAARLSYLLWDTTPDEALLALAEQGALSEPGALQDQAARLMADTEQSRPALDRFFREWIHFDGVPAYDKDTDQFPAFDDTLSASLDAELSRFIDGVLASDTPTLGHLLTSPDTEVDATLAALYGVDAPAGGEWVAVSLPSEQRAGLLTRAAILAEHSTATSSAPIFRGRLVRTQLLCDQVPAPPDDAMANAPVYPEGATERERSEILMNHMNCGACHGLMNPIGLGFEHYDASGAWREQDIDGSAVNDQGEILAGGTAVIGAFEGVPELGQILADSDDVAACFSEQFYQHTLGLDRSQVLGCAIEPARAAFVDSGGDIPSLILALVDSNAFRMRLAGQE